MKAPPPGPGNRFALCPAAEGGVERAVRIVASDDKVFVREIIVLIGCPDDDQFAISLDRHGVGDVGAMINIGHDHAADPERRIEVSIGRLRHLRRLRRRLR